LGWFHPAHGEKKSGLVSSSPWGKEKRAGFIQPMGKGKKMKGEKSKIEKERRKSKSN